MAAPVAQSGCPAAYSDGASEMTHGSRAAVSAERSVARDDLPARDVCSLRRIGTVGSRTVGTLTGDDEVDAVGDEVVAFAQMQPDLTHQLPGVVPDGPAGTADEVELVVGMGDLPS